MDVSETIQAYYDALRAGEPLPPFFAERADLVKVGITERLVGYEAVATGLREQTAETDDWTVESRELRIGERGDAAWFADEVYVTWTEAGERREHDSRWSGTLVHSDGPGDLPVESNDDGEWQFVGMHVSAPH